MLKFQNVVMLGVFAVLYLVQLGAAIRCFECNSHLNPNCSLDLPPANLSIECGDHRHGVQYTFCRKITQVIEFSVNNLPPDSRVIRGCGWDNSAYKNSCYQRAGFGGRLEVCACETDNCNGASAIATTVFGTVLTVLAAFWLRN